MGPVILNLPREARLLFNHLRIPMTPADLDDDLVCVVLPDGRRIDVSWNPAHSPIGEYTVTVYRDSWENKEEEYATDGIAEIKELVESLAQPPHVVSDCGHVKTRYKPASNSTVMCHILHRQNRRVGQHA